jgi:3-hydroxybutyryl-CoA dehydrogenase
VRAIGTVAVLGAGTMGHGIAQVAAMAGCAVHLSDESEEFVTRGLSRIRQNLEEGVARGKVTPEVRDTALARLVAFADSASSVRNADLIIEAVPEQFDLKVAVLRRAEHAAPAHAILASNTSSLSITDLQQTLTGQARVIGLHFFNPVHINRLVEVVRGGMTAQDTVDAALAFVRAIDKEAVLVNDAPGFATSRLGVLLGLEAMRMIEQGIASAQDIDRAMELGYKHPMGPLRLTDLVGLDVRLDIATYLHAKLGAEHFRPPEILKRMVAEGKLGKKSGQGFYDWTERG